MKQRAITVLTRLIHCLPTHTHKLCMLLHRDKCKSTRCVKMILQPLFCHITQRKKLTPEKPWGMTHAYHLTESGTLFWTPQVTKNKKNYNNNPQFDVFLYKAKHCCRIPPNINFFQLRSRNSLSLSSPWIIVSSPENSVDNVAVNGSFHQRLAMEVDQSDSNWKLLRLRKSIE